MVMKSINEYLLGKNTKMSKDATGFPFFVKMHPTAYDIMEIVDFLRKKDFEELEYDREGIYKNHINTQIYDKIQQKGSSVKNNYFMYGLFSENSFINFCSNEWISTRKNLFEITIYEINNRITFKKDGKSYENYEEFKEDVNNYFDW